MCHLNRYLMPCAKKFNDRSINEDEKESMVIVRPKRWIQEGKKALTITVS